MRKISELTLTFGGVGWIPFASGTWGSAAAVLCLFLIPAGVFVPVVAIGALVLLVVGSLMANDAEKLFGRPDPAPVVLDEVVGMMVSVAFLAKPDVADFILAFVLFRVFDILKPPPVRQVEKVAGGWGIFLDDVLAGLYTNAILRLLPLVL